MRRCFLVLGFLLWAIGLLPAIQAQTTTIYLVRHAEKADDGTSDPPLTEAGIARALYLAQLLSDAGLTHLHTTNYQRTRQTLEPIAETSGLMPMRYDPRDLSGFAEALREESGVHLVSGHSNTTPMLVEALGGIAGPPISESEYDRLYQLILHADGTVTTTVFRLPPY